MHRYPLKVAGDGLLRARLDMEDDVATLSLAGDFDMSAAEGLAALIDEIEDASPDRVVVDLHEITFMDSTAVRMLLEPRTRADGVHRLSVLDGSGPARQMLRLVGLDEQKLGEPPGTGEEDRSWPGRVR